jgi:hypothetical protein
VNIVMIFAAVFVSFLLQDTASKPKTQECPMHSSHDQMNARGEHAMGFSQTATTHHFLLFDSGGAIQVEANSPTDKASIDEIRMHLSHITKMFADGNFDIPMFVHDTVPPGVPEMKRLQSHIHYAFEETPNGGRVVISSADGKALAAIHRFLQFQIEEHRTGDTTAVR